MVDAGTTVVEWLTQGPNGLIILEHCNAKEQQMYDELNDYDANVDAEEAYMDGEDFEAEEYNDGEYGNEDSFIDSYYESQFERDYDF